MNSQVAKSEVAKGEVAKSENMKSQVAQSEVVKCENAQGAVAKSENAQGAVGQGKATKAEVTQGEVAEVTQGEVAKAKATEAGTTEAGTTEAGTAKPRVLFVDDVSDALRIMRMAFAFSPGVRGWQLETAGCAEEALRLYHEAKERGEPFDLIVSDIAMPDCSGLMMVRRLRETGDGVKVIFYTAHNGAINRQTAEDLDALDYVMKPVNPSELIERIRAVFGL